MSIALVAVAALLSALYGQPAPGRPTVAPAPPAPAVAVPATPPAAGRDLADFIRRSETDSRSASRSYDLPWSETRFDRMSKAYKEWQDRLASQDFAALDQAGKIDAILLRNELRSSEAHLDLDRKRLV